jgi:membrane-bound lytic murein transglycosylase A
MIAQDTGSAITGPARADLYFGAGPDAAKVSGRLRHPMRFVMLVPKSLDPVALGREMPLPDPRPSEKIAKLFPQVDPLKNQPKVQKNATPTGPSPVVAQAPNAGAGDARIVPLPEARPVIETARERRHHRRVRRYHGDR